MRQRLKNSFDNFIDVNDKSDIEVAQLSRSLNIDIAIDLKGFTQNARPGIFSYRAAPIQINYLGYPGTMGSEYIDYIIADKIVIPSESEKHYSEKIIYLPHSYQVNDRKRLISDRKFTKLELGLPESGFIFCCFNNGYKILPSIFDAWMRILKSVDGSVLWLYEDNPNASESLVSEAQKSGVEGGRLVFAKSVPLPEHLARQSMADLFLDTFPYGAHTTASDALWSGLPLITQKGNSFASRVAASLLNEVGLIDLVTATQADYEALAIELATSPSKLYEVKNRLAQNLQTATLFDTPVFTKNLEAAFMIAYDRYKENLGVDHIHLS